MDERHDKGSCRCRGSVLKIKHVGRHSLIFLKWQYNANRGIALPPPDLFFGNDSNRAAALYNLQLQRFTTSSFEIPPPNLFFDFSSSA